MRKMDLSDVCHYMKAIVVPDIPEDFTVAETFKHDLPDTALKAGITAFRTFLYTLYDKIAAEKDTIDVGAGKNFDPDSVDVLTHVCHEGSIHTCFPIINDMAVILFSLGYHSKLETKPAYKLIVTGNALLTPYDHKNEKINSFAAMGNERKTMLFNMLAVLGFTFEGIDLATAIDFSSIKTFTVTHHHAYTPLGLKILAEAQAAKKSSSGYYYLKTLLMRGDFYPLANKKVRVKDLHFQLFLNPHPPAIRAWITTLDTILTDNGCSVAGVINNYNVNIIFTYTSRRTNKDICKIHMGMEGCKAFPYGRHLNSRENILAHLPDSMFDALSDGSHACTGCATKRPDLIDHNIHYTFNGQAIRRCHNKGFGFSLDHADVRDTIEKWIMMELASS